MKSQESTHILSPSTVGGTAMGILFALSLAHWTNDTLQAVISAIYLMLKSELALSFAQIGVLTLVYQICASVFQPVVGMVMDKRQSVWTLPVGMLFIFVGLILLAFVQQWWLVLCAVGIVGVGSSIFHPVASRLTSMASGGKRGLAQSIFQVGGNLGSSIGPLLAALLVAPFGRQNLWLVALFAFIGFAAMVPICRWYARVLRQLRSAPPSKEAMRRSQPLSNRHTFVVICVIMLLIFSKYIYMASMGSYYTFFLIERFGVSVQASQIYLCIFLFATATGTLVGGPIGDKIGRKYVIWGSILGVTPFTLLMPYVGLFWTVVLSFVIGFILSSAMPAILVYSQELLPYKLGLVSGIFFGFSFGVAGIASAVLGGMADVYGIEHVYRLVSYTPLMGLLAWYLPNLHSPRTSS